VDARATPKVNVKQGISAIMIMLHHYVLPSLKMANLVTMTLSA